MPFVNTPLIAPLMLLAMTVVAFDATGAGPLQRQAEDAAAAAERSKEETRRLRANEPLPHARPALKRQHKDALERAVRQERKVRRNAAGAVHDANRAARRAADVSRERGARQRRQEQKREERRRREVDGR